MQDSGDLLRGVGDVEVRGCADFQALGNALNLELWFTGVYQTLMVHNMYS